MLTCGAWSVGRWGCRYCSDVNYPVYRDPGGGREDYTRNDRVAAFTPLLGCSQSITPTRYFTAISLPLDFHVPSATKLHLWTNRTVTILLHHFKVQVTKPQVKAGHILNISNSQLVPSFYRPVIRIGHCTTSHTFKMILRQFKIQGACLTHNIDHISGQISGQLVRSLMLIPLNSIGLPHTLNILLHQFKI